MRATRASSTPRPPISTHPFISTSWGVKQLKGEHLYNFRHKAVWGAGSAYPVAELNEEEWGIPKIENKRTSIPIAFDLFPTYPSVNEFGLAISYLTAKRSIGTLAQQYINRNHIMKGEYITEDFKADHDTILGTIIAARLVNEPEEPALFIPEPAICRVLGVIWPLAEHGEAMIAKMREAVAKGRKSEVGASYELFFNDKGFVWGGQLYQENYIETERDGEILNELYNCLGYKDGMTYVASSYEGEKPVLLAGGADGFVLFHGAGLAEGDNVPAYSEMKGQFNLLATRKIPAFIAHAGLIRYVEQTNQEASVEKDEIQKLFADFKEAIAGLVKPAAGEPPKPIDEKLLADTFEKVLGARNEESDAKFSAAVAAKVEEEKPKIEKEIRDGLEAEAKAFTEMLTLCGENEVEVKDAVAENERAIAAKTLTEFAKEPDGAMTKLKAEIFGLPNDKNPERSKAAGLPTGGSGGATSPFQTPEEIEQGVDK